MAWENTLLEASFRGVVFDCRETDDHASQATAEHAYPYVDGADIEDLGRGPRRISIDAVFFGDDYESRLLDFMQVLDERGSGELIHPVFGALTVQLLDRRIHHDAEHVDQATVRIEFAESTPSEPFFDRRLASQKADAIAAPGVEATDAAAEEAMSLIEELRNANPLAALDSLRAEMLGPVLDGIAMVNGIVASGLDVLDVPRAWVSDINAIVDGVLGMGKFADTLLFDWNSLLANIKVIGRKISGDANPVSSGYTPTEAQAKDSVAVFLTVAAATATAEGAGLLLAAEANTATLSPVEIEAVANEARTAIDEAIVATRQVYAVETARTITEPLKDQALAVQEAARAIIEARPPLLVKAAPASGNLRLLAHLFYGDHTRATELMRLNPALRNPNAIQPGDTLNAYAR